MDNCHDGQKFQVSNKRRNFCYHHEHPAEGVGYIKFCSLAIGGEALNFSSTRGVYPASSFALMRGSQEKFVTTKRDIRLYAREARSCYTKNKHSDIFDI